MQFIKTGALAAAICVAATSFYEVAQAGELYQNQQRIRVGSAGVRTRKVFSSTRASKLLDKSRRLGSPVISYSQSSPYEYRMTKYNNAVQRYERDYAKWENRVESIENKNEAKEQRKNEQSYLKQKREKERAMAKQAREDQKAARLRARDDSSKTGFFARAFGGNAANGKEEAVNNGNKETAAIEVQDSKSKKAEAFFGGAEETQTAAIAASAAEAPAPKLSFLQRLKKAMFGG